VSGERDRLLARIRHLLTDYVQPARFGPTVPVQLAVHRLHGEPVGYDEGVKGPWEPFSVGDRWGGTWDTSWFQVRGRIPAEWTGERVDLRLDIGYHGSPGFGSEGLVWRHGAPLAGINSRHQEVALFDPARGGETVELYVEAAANPRAGDARLHAPDYGDDTLLVCERAELAVRNTEVDALFIDLLVLTELAEDLPVDERRTGEVLSALRVAAAALDPGAVAATAGTVRAILAEPLARPASPTSHHISAVGHAHIDSAWLWPLRETVRKCARTFSTAVQLLDAYPDYEFACSQAQQHAWMRDRYPDLFARMQDHAAKGRFEPVGSMWVEPDCNLPSGEALVRQFVYGKRFFSEAYGIETVECWLPDAFGYPASMPQIMAQAGVTAFISQKLSWNESNRYPHHTFWWEGIDGSRVLTHFPPADTYNGDFSVAQLRYSARNFADHLTSGASLYLFGYGDGGGGPTEEMLQRAERVADLDGVPRVTLEPARSFLDRVTAEEPDLASWVGELYLEYHRGTYTSQARTKAGNRRGEIALYSAELWSTLLGSGQDSDSRATLAEAWRTLLLHQFHDILPGSSINWVHEDTAVAHTEVLEAAGAVLSAAEAVLASSVDTSWASRPVLITNATSHGRHEVVALPAGLTEDITGDRPGVLVDSDGRRSPLQPTADGSWLASVDVPACGWATFDLAVGEAVAPEAVVPEAVVNGAVVASKDRLENDRLVVRFDAGGLVTSIYDKLAGREVLAAGEQGNVLHLHDDEPVKYDAWDIDEFYGDRVQSLTDAESVEVVEEGPLRGAVRVVRRFGASTLSQVIRLEAGSARLDFDTEVDWHERHRLLKATFPVAVRSPRASYEIQFGHLERPTHKNTSWDKARFEVVGHRWADLSEPGYGVALLNDSKYGYHIDGHTMELSLLRSPTAPDPEADQGRHHFVYSLLPHRGDLQEAGVVAAGYDLNVPLRATAVAAGVDGTRSARQSVVSFDRPGVVLSAVKYAEDSDDVVVRFYEAHGSRGPVRIDVALPLTAAVRTDLLERPGEPVAVTTTDHGAAIELEVRPFEIVTLKAGLAAPAR
jgi:alpha-mannosidase